MTLNNQPPLDEGAFSCLTGLSRQTKKAAHNVPRLVYLVDDERPQRELITLQLDKQGIKSRAFSNGYDLLNTLKAEATRPDALLVDLMMPGLDGIALINMLRGISPQTPVVILTGRGSIETAVHAMKAGAADYITKPADGPRLQVTLQNAMEKAGLKDEVARLTREASNTVAFDDIIGTSPIMQKLFLQLGRAARSDITVCLHGASGTGKELIARAIHHNSQRRDKPFVVVNCAAIAPNLIESTLFGHEKGAFTGAAERRIGKFQEADGGSVFLDEIAELDLNAQTRLLRVLQEREIEPLGSVHTSRVNIRLITATHRNLQNMVSDGTFREDLYYRIHVLPVSIPSLSKRREDIPLLAKHYVKRFCLQENIPEKTITPEGVAWLSHQPWPGNVRELENTLYRAVILSDASTLDVEDLSGQSANITPSVFDTFTMKDTEDLPNLSDLQQAYIDYIISRTQGNLTHAARLLGIGRTTLYRHKHNGSKKVVQQAKPLW